MGDLLFILFGPDWTAVGRETSVLRCSVSS